jgi:predicted AAA+ superfamily ATPase
VDLLQRNLTGRVGELLGSFRAVVLGGPRQSGKTTLVRDLLDLPAGAQFSFDDEATLQRALQDPVGFIEVLPQPAAIDEFQRAGRGFLLAVKQSVDIHRQRGQLLLTGSANYLADRSTAETLAGRTGRVELWPLSAGERRGVRETFVDRLFEPDAWPPPATESLARADLVGWLLEGGYPEIVTEGLTGRRRRDWFEAYVLDVVSREALRPLAEIRLEAELRRVLRLLCARTAQELVFTDLVDDAQLNRETVANYVALLDALFLVQQVPAWASSATTRAKRRSKIVIRDTGLAADVIGVGEAEFGPNADGRAAGALFETFVITEVAKQTGWSERSLTLAHYRDRNGAEIDLIVEDRRTGQVAALEIKLTATPTERHARHLATLRDGLGDRFTVGLVVHAGRQILPLGPRLWAVPTPTLWRSDR